MTPIKVFISYSWKPIHHKQKVLQLAERLSSDFVHVILDDWDLKEGHDKYAFMEQMVNNPEVKRVLLICNKDYAEKANFKKGGVGIESLIISNEIYTNADQTKFIPVIFEYDENSNACVPTFVKGRIFIDLSTEIVFEENYEKLLRNIFDKPSSKRPPIGTIPSFLLSDEPIYLPTAHKVNTIRNALLNEKKNSPLYIRDYLETFVSSQKLFLIELKDLNQNNFEEIVLKKIEDMKVLRDDFINFLEVYLLNSLSIDAELLHDFFEKILSWIYSVTEFGSLDKNLDALRFDNFRYFYYELFLTFSTMMLQKEKFSELSYILQTPFIITKNKRGEIEQFTFSEFRYYNYTLNEFHNQKYSPKKISVTADTIKQRATERYNFELLIETDVLLYYISLFFPNTKSYHRGCWFPETSCYRFYKLKVLSKSLSERYFNKVKVLFGVKDKNELVAKSEEIDKSERGFNDFNYRIPNVKVGLNITGMCTLP